MASFWQELKQIEFMSEIIMEQTEFTLKELGKDIELDLYLLAEIAVIKLINGDLKILYDRKPALVFKGTNIHTGGKTLNIKNIKLNMLIMVGIIKVGCILKVRLIFQSNSGGVYKVEFDALNIDIE